LVYFHFVVSHYLFHPVQKAQEDTVKFRDLQ
jgi:hypothetical protein